MSLRLMHGLMGAALALLTVIGGAELAQAQQIGTFVLKFGEAPLVAAPGPHFEIFGNDGAGGNDGLGFETKKTDDVEADELLPVPTGLPHIQSTLTGLSQNANMELFDGTGDATDMGVTSFSNSTRIRSFNRYGVSSSAAAGTARVGAMQYKFDLTPLEGYLSTNALALDTLELRLDLQTNSNGWNGSKSIDVVMSYDSAAESIAIADIDTTLTDNWSTGGAPQNHANLWHPLHGTTSAFATGDVNEDGSVDQTDLGIIQSGYGTGTTLATGDVDGSGKVNGRDVLLWQQNFGASPPPPAPVINEGEVYGGNYYLLDKEMTLLTGQTVSTTRDLATLYAEGVREFNVIMFSGDFIPGRDWNIQSTSGISITTSAAPLSASAAAVPEPTSLALAAISMIGLLQYRRK